MRDGGATKDARLGDVVRGGVGEADPCSILVAAVEVGKREETCEGSYQSSRPPLRKERTVKSLDRKGVPAVQRDEALRKVSANVELAERGHLEKVDDLILRS